MGGDTSFENPIPLHRLLTDDLRVLAEPGESRLGRSAGRRRRRGPWWRPPRWPRSGPAAGGGSPAEPRLAGDQAACHELLQAGEEHRHALARDLQQLTQLAVGERAVGAARGLLAA